MNSIINDILIGWTYKHIDWPKYKVYEILPDATWYETTWGIWKSVKYEQLDAWEAYPAWTIWVRKIEDFLGTVEVEGQQKNIFELIR